MQFQFDANTVQPSTGQPDPIPAGWYKMAIDESEMKPTKDGAGTYLQLRLSVIDGPHKGAKVWDRLNVRNNNEVAQRIAYETLSAICHATGVIQMQDSEQLHNIPMNVKVKLRAADGDYDASNETAGYKNANENVGEAGQQAQAQQQPQGQQSQPWESNPQQGQQQQAQPQQQAAMEQNAQQGSWQQPQGGGGGQPWEQGQPQDQPQGQPQDQPQDQAQQGQGPSDGKPPWQ